MIIPIDSRAKAFIFDVDGTLADTMPLHYQAWCEVAQRRGFVFSEKDFYSYAGIPTEKILERINKAQGLSLEKNVAHEKEMVFLQRIDLVKPIEPVVRIVREYHGKIPMSLGTGNGRKLVELTIRTIGLEGFFDIIVTREDVVNHKPDPDTFLECARLMKVKPSDCLVFEDGDQGLDAARRAGMIPLDVRLFI
jgi:beta-phosphoglucomutase family hydrolase